MYKYVDTSVGYVWTIKEGSFVLVHVTSEVFEGLITKRCYVYIAIVVQKKTTSSTQGFLTSLNTSVLDWPAPHATIAIPLDKFKEYENNGSVIVISTALRNVTYFFSNTSENSTT